MKKFTLLFICLLSIQVFSQKPVILISNKYEFQKKPNTYNINNMLKAVLVSNNYEVYFDDEPLPAEVANNRCDVLTGVLLDKSNMFMTKIKLQIKDCQNMILFETDEVKSKDKDIQAGFIETIRLLSPELKKFKPSIKKQDVVTIAKDETVSTSQKYQLVEVTNGYVLMDASLKAKLQIYKTTNPTVFIADKFGVKGVFTKLPNKGIFEYYMNDALVVEEFLF